MLLKLGEFVASLQQLLVVASLLRLGAREAKGQGGSDSVSLNWFVPERENVRVFGKYPNIYTGAWTYRNAPSCFSLGGRPTVSELASYSPGSWMSSALCTFHLGRLV